MCIRDSINPDGFEAIVVIMSKTFTRELLGSSLNIFFEFSIFYFLVCNVFNLGFNISVNKSAIKFILT